MLTALSTILVMLAAMLLIGAALHDIAARTIPNWIPVALGFDGLALQVLHGDWLLSLAAGLAVFVTAALLWRRGLIGGGDVKLLGAAAIVVSAGLTVSMLVAVSLAGGGLAVLYWILSRVVGPPGAVRPAHRLARIARVERRRIRQCRSLPYACAIASGALFVMMKG